MGSQVEKDEDEFETEQVSGLGSAVELDGSGEGEKLSVTAGSSSVLCSDPLLLPHSKIASELSKLSSFTCDGSGGAMKLSPSARKNILGALAWLCECSKNPQDVPFKKWMHDTCSVSPLLQLFKTQVGDWEVASAVGDLLASCTYVEAGASQNERQVARQFANAIVDNDDGIPALISANNTYARSIKYMHNGGHLDAWYMTQLAICNTIFWTSATDVIPRNQKLQLLQSISTAMKSLPESHQLDPKYQKMIGIQFCTMSFLVKNGCLDRHDMKNQKVLQQSLQVLANGGWMNVDSALDAAVRFFADGIMHSIFTDERDLGFLLPLCHIVLKKSLNPIFDSSVFVILEQACTTLPKTSLAKSRIIIPLGILWSLSGDEYVNIRGWAHYILCKMVT